jgi:hypothetical protein
LETRARTAADEQAPPHPLGRTTVDQGPTLALGRDADGAHVLDISDTGRFRIEDARIEHARPHDADPRAVALDLVGHVLPLALERTGAWVLHASAVALPHGALLFVGPRGAGKSTLAAACALAGASLVADDAVACVPRDDAPLALPAGLPLRLRPDAARTLGLAPTAPDDGDDDDDGWGKRRVAVATATAPLPIAAIALLTPVAHGTPARAPVPAPFAVALLAASGKLAALHDAEGRARALRHAADLVARVPVERLVIPRAGTTPAATARAVLAAYAPPVAGAA